MLIITACVLLLISSTLRCDFTTANEWTCLSCGGPFTCTETDSCFANAGDV